MDAKDSIRTEPGQSPEELAADMLNRAGKAGAEVIDFTGRPGRHPNGCVCAGCQAKRGGKEAPKGGKRAPSRSNRIVAPQNQAVVEPPPAPLTEAEIDELTKQLSPLVYIGMAVPINKSFPDQPYQLEEEAVPLTKAAIPVVAKWGGGSIAAHAPELALIACICGQILGRILVKIENDRAKLKEAGATGPNITSITEANANA